MSGSRIACSPSQSRRRSARRVECLWLAHCRRRAFKLHRASTMENR
jgi:hypothetical protein